MFYLRKGERDFSYTKAYKQLLVRVKYCFTFEPLSSWCMYYRSQAAPALSTATYMLVAMVSLRTADETL